MYFIPSFWKFDQIMDSPNARLTTEFGVAELAATILKSGGWKQVNNMLFCPENEDSWATFCPYFHWVVEQDNRRKAGLPEIPCPFSRDEIDQAIQMRVKAVDGHHRYI
jgi:hypothetical protein